ncbi:hypothetical protein [Burkholderia vietnamiensis]|uniref:hypothetical protein n=1 Tax=Burkholderia vietnamiensis TaxID=60552 RepID=UPI001D14D3CA|nr:hypothetical protein [Burkholderia vietnamiensis]UEC05510.1 hypothetical protein LK462_35470 [Burkholderia vietnamiensis]
MGQPFTQNVRIFDPHDEACQLRVRDAMRGRTRGELAELVMIQEEREADQIDAMERAAELIRTGRVNDAYEYLARAAQNFRRMHVDRAAFWFWRKSP